MTAPLKRARATLGAALGGLLVHLEIGLWPFGLDSTEARRRRLDAMTKAYVRRGVIPASAPIVDARDVAKGGWVILDAREPEERAVSRVPGAIAPSELDVDWAKASGARVACYCTAGVRSGHVAAELRRQGVDCANMLGVLQWLHETGLPLVDLEGAPVHRVHVYGPLWNLAPTDYEAVMFSQRR